MIISINHQIKRIIFIINSKPYKTLKIVPPSIDPIKITLNTQYNKAVIERNKHNRENIPKLKPYKPRIIERTHSKHIDISHILSYSYSPVIQKKIKKKEKKDSMPEIERRIHSLRFENDEMKQKIYDLDKYFLNLRSETLKSYDRVNKSLENNDNRYQCNFVIY